ncbi:hypothetical protein VCB84_002608 [Providencia rettgeri]|uniref:hypothetical protein n=1 Tax=Providencia rettgeri TaxID=587 RepID=UPI0024A40BC2|nr:hypothetical protein [Providencia rettgeri]ELR5235875.1 hypothetical protein [Providencia rettgeri]ELU1336770.1 hypothetical protein [Providencia rettgeri]EMC2742003.1 hypothetical protein [Providencia rettgeri]EMD6656645.1 hypothetical protein [Providencia rettgeri]
MSQSEPYLVKIVHLKPVNESMKGGFNIKNEPTLDWLNRDILNSWVEYRKDMKKVVKTKQIFNLQIKFLAECFEKGHFPDEVINQTIANRWLKYCDGQHLMHGKSWSERN